ncbi:uncharacterized protein EI97DRAFT_470274 [Westerdykella ornata]|uniref:Zn(2)-C6 fungal-type domain-containing protein n=1 Tax=Westerdykella ornata TaxID=318751 RepID=A0A6A6JBJ3_WESOR|nr:uncharacterized protein EI97DRAFT_470274 [Westerdykella ornata]KAF2272559.1 hypothetical protein EI97DRAFT_470274 [Westerdykella ornata]
MGRKPNQLILEFFERGPKLEDASNRYQHTCKSCGEKFPKGRIDSLTNHLVKKCPALPLRDRQRALLQFHDLPADLSDMAQMASMQVQAQAHGQAQNGPSPNLPFMPSKQGMSALETLAEVSRQHLDLSGKRVPAKQGRRPPPPQSNHLGQHGAFMDEFLMHDDRPDAQELGIASQGSETSGAPTVPSMYQFSGPLQDSPTNSPHIGDMPVATSASLNQMVPSLVMTASAANELSNIMPNGLMESDLNLTGVSASDKFLQNHERQQWSHLPQSSIDPLLGDQNRNQMLPKDDSMHKAISPPRPIAMNPHGNQAHFTTDFSVNQKPSKPRVRGRFPENRRKEVQEIRKRGACIRCRMLKKPCSGDSPCNTCKNVESARLWKQPCIRTRIAEEFNLYSAGLHGMLAFQAVGHMKSQIRFDQVPGRIEATHHLDSGIFATFAPLRSQYQPLAGSEIDPSILATLPCSSYEIIDGDDDIGGKLDLYIKKASTSFFDSEDSSFMKITALVALSIASTNQGGLLSKALELWHWTRILTSKDLEWHVFFNPSLPPTMMPSAMSQSDMENSARTPITPESNSASYELIKLQLQGAAEKRAACLARIVMNDLERRLLQRQQANPFETFLVAVILLACAERMCWLFRAWEEDVTPHQPTTDTYPEPNAPNPPAMASTTESHELLSAASEPHSDASIAHALQSASTSAPATLHQSADSLSLPHHPKWPFDRPPAYYSQQGERISDILNMLLKMRGVPPKPVARFWDNDGDGDGMLVIRPDDVDADDRAREWYEGIGVTVWRLQEAAQARFEGVDAKEWQLKFVGKILRGEVKEESRVWR